MKKIVSFLLFTLCLINFGFAQYANVIDPELQQIINEKNDELISVNIILKSQIDVEKLNLKRQAFVNKTARKEFVLKEFKSFSQKSQADVLSFLEAEHRSNQVVDIKCHWITNMINCKTTADVVYKLAQHPDVAAIAYNKKEYMLFDEKSQAVEPVRGILDNVKKVNADDVWELGYTGKGVLVSILDTGVNINHHDLKDHLWDGGEEYPNHGYNTVDNNHDITDRDGHGTHCAGTICGDGTSGSQTGVAPDATLMCVKIIGDDGSGSVEAIVAGIEFSVEHGADIINISAGFTYPNLYVNNIIRQSFINTLTFDVVASVAAGNERDYLDYYPIPRNVSAPGNCPPPWLHPDQQANAGGLTSVVCIGAVDYNDKPAYFSSEGPVTWLGTTWNDYLLDMTSDLEEGWLYYDNSYYVQNIGGVNSFSWGIMFPPSKLQDFTNGELTKVAVYDAVYFNGNIEIYQGGDTPDKGTLLHTQAFTCFGTNAFVEFNLNNIIEIDNTQNLWIIIQTDEGMAFPVAACPMTEDPNGRWIEMNGVWLDNCEYNINYTWLLRAFVRNNDGKTSTLANENEYGLIRPDVCAPGVGIVSLANFSNKDYTMLSGTSMATPCVSGAMALMLEKNPELTPAQICEILETTAVKLTDKKSNRTGSGRINVLAAIESIEDEIIDTTNVNVNLEREFRIYPNPVNDKLFIDTDDNVKNIEIYDIIGVAVYSNNEHDNIIDVSGFKNGVYFINIKTDEGCIIKRFIKN